MTDMKACSIADGQILAANNNRYVTIGGRLAIIHHNCWISTVAGEQHQVGLDFSSDVATASGPASDECRAIVVKLFPECT